MRIMVVDDASDHQTLTEAIIENPAVLFVLRYRAKTMFSEVCAEALAHPNAKGWMDKWPILKGFKWAAWDEGDPTYLGMFAGRVWFGDKN